MTNETVYSANDKKKVNHICFVVDESGSMNYHMNAVRELFGTMIASLASANKDQDTRFTVYAFDDNVRKLAIDANYDVASRVAFRPGGMTALIDAVASVITDYDNHAFPEDEDHTFLVYIVTDGQENASRKYNRQWLSRAIQLRSDRWTFGALVPDSSGVYYAKNLGLPSGNITIWNVQSSRGFEEVSRSVTSSYANYTSARSAGFTTTSTLFVNAANINVADAETLTPITATHYHVDTTARIDEFCRDKLGHYPKGNVFYQLTKKETVQPNKEIAVENKQSGKIYAGVDARMLLGLPPGYINVRPGDFGDWNVFVQSTSQNRKLVGGTDVLVRQ